MKAKINCFLVLGITCMLLNAFLPVRAGNKSPLPVAKVKKAAVVKPAASCIGVPPFIFGIMYFTGSRVVYNGSLYMATKNNQAQFPFIGQYWIWLGPCN